MCSVKLDKVTKVFPPNVVAVDNVTLDVGKGEFFVVLGPSGCGKTTLLRIIAGLERPTSGRVYIDGEDVTDLPPRKRDVAMVFQNWALYPHMKVYDNIAFPLKLKKLPQSEIDRRVREVARLLKIEDLLDRYPRQLSGGQQQRVALARALVKNPRVWLMDEPLSNLDALLRVHMRAELKRIQKELKITTIYVTHDQVEAMTMADRVAVMNAGKVLQVGTPSEVYNKPKTLFVAGFIGSPPMNFIQVELQEVKGKYVLRHEKFAIELPDEYAKAISTRTGSTLVLGIRPEHIKIESNGEIEGEVYVVEPLGSEAIVNVRVGDCIIKVKTPEPIDLPIGSRIRLKLDLSKVHLFDVKTGEAIL